MARLRFRMNVKRTAWATAAEAEALGVKQLPCYTQAPNLRKRGELWESPRLKVLLRTAKFAYLQRFDCRSERRSMWSSRMLRCKLWRTLAVRGSPVKRAISPKKLPSVKEATVREAPLSDT